MDDRLKLRIKRALAIVTVLVIIGVFAFITYFFTVEFGNMKSAEDFKEYVDSFGRWGLLVGLGYVCFSKGFKENVSPVKAAVISYIEPVLNPIWVLIFIGEKITPLALVGIVIVLVTAIIYSIKNSLSKKEEN